VPIKTETQQAVLMSHRTRDFLVRQLTQLANAIRAHKLVIVAVARRLVAIANAILKTGVQWRQNPVK
jgi:transposase